jgi:hypothetical protein
MAGINGVIGLFRKNLSPLHDASQGARSEVRVKAGGRLHIAARNYRNHLYFNRFLTSRNIHTPPFRMPDAPASGTRIFAT